MLLAVLVLSASAAVVALLAWAGTRSAGSLLLLFVLAIVAGLSLLLAASYEEDLTGVEEASADDAAAIPEATESPAPEATATETPEPAPPDQFTVEPATLAGAFANPTSFAIGDAGELYVGHSAGIERIEDTTGDGYYDSRVHFGLEGGWVFGLVYHEGAVYAAVAGRVLRLADLDGDGTADETRVLLEGLPYNQYGGHSNSGIAVGPDDQLYMAIGGTSDHGPELEPYGGTILTMSLGGGEPEVYATGFRNPYDLAFCPDGRLYATDNGPDQMGDDLMTRPWDEVNLVERGGHYGYPDHFGPVSPDTGTISPIADVAPSAGITGITCYAGGGYPEAYEGDLFVTLWGTFTYPTETGRRVMRVTLEETPDGPRGAAFEFARDFGHPIDIVVDENGNLLVLDYERGQILRIAYPNV